MAADNPEGPTPTREALAATTFVELVESLVDEFDVIDLLTVLANRCVDLLDASAAGILLADTEGHLRVMASSSEQAELLELFQVQNEQGPCLDCFSSGEPVVAGDLGAVGGNWPMFATESLAAGLRSVYAVPMRLRDRMLGCLNLFLTRPGSVSGEDVALAQALADVASIAIIQNQAARDAADRQHHLQRALDSRVAIEQAKGMISERAKVDMDVAFTRLRHFARSNNRGLTDTALELVAGRLDLSVVAQTT